MVKNEWVELIAKDQMMVAARQVKLVWIEISGSRGGEPWALRAPSPLTRDINQNIRNLILFKLSLDQFEIYTYDISIK